MIYLTPEVASGLGEDTFWTFALREFPDAVMGSPERVTDDDVILRYSTKRDESRFPAHTIGLLWELHPEMKSVLKSTQWDNTLTVIDECGRSSARITTASALMVPYYSHYGKPVDVLPIGVDTKLFRPHDKQAMRAKHNLPQDKHIGIWVGTTHEMKGFDRLREYAAQHPNIFWIIVWKSEEESAPLPGAHNRVLVSQQELSELMSSADFFLSCGRLRPFFLVEWEAMACDVPMVLLDTEKDFVPSASPRTDIFDRGWSRTQAKQTWLSYIQKFRETR